MEERRRKSMIALAATVVFIILLVLTVGGAVYLNGKRPEKAEEYEWISSDPAAVNGMLDGEYYTGKKNDASTLSYKIAESINVDAMGKGNFKIENSGKNVCLMKVTLLLDGEVIYQTDYIKPNQHILTDRLDSIPAPGDYPVEAVFEGFDPNTEESIGQTTTTLALSVLAS